MRLLPLCLIALPLALPPSAWAKLEIRNVQPAHGAIGPPRMNDDVYPLDEYVVRYQVAGVKADKDGNADLEIAVRLANPEGKTILDRKTAPAQRPMVLGGDVIQTFGVITIPEKAPPGAYKLSVVVRDRASAESTSFDRTLTIKPAEFRILVPRFYHDSDGKVPAGTTLPAGSALYVRFKVVGFDAAKKPALTMKAVVVDADGKPVGGKVLSGKGDVAAKEADAKQAQFATSLMLHRPGSFRLRITVDDSASKKTASVELPFQVKEP